MSSQEDSDSLSLSQRPHDTPPKRSVWKRAKKNLTSKSLDTKIGRKTLIAFVGNEGNEIIQALKDAIDRYKGHDEAKKAKKTILKTAVKIRGLAEENALTPEIMRPAVVPFNSLAVCILWQLEKSFQVKQNLEEKLDTPKLVEYFDAARQVSMDILSNKMTKKNVEALASLIKFLGSADFLDTLLYDLDYNDHKKVILENLRLIMKPWLERHKPQIPCQMYGCDQFCVSIHGGFSSYCGVHHDKVMEEEMKSPQVETWLQNPERFRIFSEFLRKSTDMGMNDLAFLRAVDDFEQIENLHTLQGRARIIFRKYLRKRSKKKVDVDRELAEKIRDSLLDEPRHSLFRDVYREIFQRLDKVFTEQFVCSAVYNRYWEFQHRNEEY